MPWNSSGLALLPAPAQLVQAQKVTTKGDQSAIYSAGTAPAFDTVGALDTQAIIVDPYELGQPILGFGAALTDSSAYLLTNNLTQAQRTALLTRLYSPAQGNLSTVRICVGDSDFRVDPNYYSYDESGTPDTSLSNFSIARDQRYIIPVLQEIRAINPNVRVIASMWSPPAWMKTLQAGASALDMAQGGMNNSYLQHLANYWVAFLNAYAQLGIQVYAITGQNEPSAVYVGRPSMILTNTQALAFYGPILRPTLDAAGFQSVKLWPCDSSWNPALSIFPTYMADTTTTQSIDGYSFHGYSGDPIKGQLPVRRGSAKTVHLTEYRTLLSQSWSSSIRDMVGMHLIDTIRAGAESVTFWNLALDPSGNPTQGSTGRRGVVTVNTDGTGVAMGADGVTFAGAPDVYALLHVAPFLRPGARRVASTSTSTYAADSTFTAGLMSVAFINTDGEVVLVVYNGTGSAVTTQIGDARTNQAFTDTFAAGDVVTYRWGTARTSLPTAAVAPLTAPTAPSLTATAGKLSVSLAITAGTAGSTPTRYRRIYRSVDGGVAALLAVTTGTSYVDTTTTTSHAYAYTAIDYGTKPSPASTTTAAVTPAAGTVPGAPTNVAAASGSNSATVTWTAPADNGGAKITSYTVQRATTGAYATVGTTSDGVTTSYTDITAAAGTAYTYKVIATNSIGSSVASSASASVTPFAAVALSSTTLFPSTAQTNPYNFNATPNAGDTLVLVEIGYATFDANGGAISGVTWGGNAMTKVLSYKPGTAQQGGDRCIDVWSYYASGGLGTASTAVAINFSRGGTTTHIPNVGAAALTFAGCNGTIQNVAAQLVNGASGVTQLQTTSPGTQTKDLVVTFGSFRNATYPVISESNATRVVQQVPVSGSNEANEVWTQPGSASSQTSTVTGITSSAYTQVLASVTLQGT